MDLHSWVYSIDWSISELKFTFLTREPLLTRQCSNHSEKPYHEERQTTVLDDSRCANLEVTRSEENPRRQNCEDT
jgi:hypothetical protein